MSRYRADFFTNLSAPFIFGPMSTALAYRLPATPLSFDARAQSFLKWAGGKSQLVPEILARFPDRFGRYFEPFIGGGAVFFALGPKRAVLADINRDLVDTYRAIREELPLVMTYLAEHEATEQHFYNVRAQDPRSLCRAQKAARFIFLNRTCFNGLYRVNRAGQFNVPFGRYKNPTLCNAERLERVAEALRGVELVDCSVFELFRRVRPRKNDLVYFDPPYDPLTPTASFTSYTAEGFGRDQQAKLAELFKSLANQGVHVVLSNSDTPFINELYKDFRRDRVYARRAINSQASRRGPVTELIVTSR
jgi:DNA adenine methylase